MNLVIRFYGHSNNLFFFAATHEHSPIHHIRDEMHPPHACAAIDGGRLAHDTVLAPSLRHWNTG
jgi:hypothetical protein